jgi:hypothetical protein
LYQLYKNRHHHNPQEEFQSPLLQLRHHLHPLGMKEKHLHHFLVVD